MDILSYIHSHSVSKGSSHFKPMISSDMFIHLWESSEKNKQNCRKVKYHQATGSRSYVAHLHAYVSKEDVVHNCSEQLILHLI
jgi:hypothetical protein